MTTASPTISMSWSPYMPGSDHQSAMQLSCLWRQGEALYIFTYRHVFMDISKPDTALTRRERGGGKRRRTYMPRTGRIEQM